MNKNFTLLRDCPFCGSSMLQVNLEGWGIVREFVTCLNCGSGGRCRSCNHRVGDGKMLGFIARVIFHIYKHISSNGVFGRGEIGRLKKRIQELEDQAEYQNGVIVRFSQENELLKKNNT